MAGHERTLLVVAILSVGMAACRGRDASWDCRPLGPARECAAREKTARPGLAWACHEWRGNILCASPPAGSDPPAPWRCRVESGLRLCAVGDLAFPPGDDPASWRCAIDEQGTRRCHPRAFGNDPWRCEGARCTRRYPDYPSEWEWECYRSDGRDICRSDMPAGSDRDWHCAERDGKTLCVDPDPDLPDSSESWICKYGQGPGRGITCDRAPAAPPCAGDVACPGGFCVQGQCVAVRLAPDCYFPQDCKAGTCVGGTCVAPKR